jgi:DNA-binding transcriptional LysR family regulator
VDLDRFDLNLLRVLDALLDERQVSAAARRLGLSQPAASSALARLRKALGDPLLIRAGNGMRLTPLALELQPRVRRALDDLRAALSAATTFDARTTRRVFRIGADDYATVIRPWCCSPRWLRACGARHHTPGSRSGPSRSHSKNVSPCATGTWP